MKFNWVTIKVKDMDESLKFYNEILGLKIFRQLDAGPGRKIVFLGEGETKVELIWEEGLKDVNIGPDISIGFQVESVDNMMSYLKEKEIEIISGPIQPNPHIRFFFIRDPNGVTIQLAEKFIVVN